MNTEKHTKFPTGLTAVVACLTLASIPAHGALVGHWEFDNSADVGQATVSDDLEAVGNAAYTAAGKVGGALILDGSGDYLRVNGSHNLATGLPTGNGAFTLAAFIQPTAARDGIIGWGNYGSNGRVNAFRTGDSLNTLTHYSWSTAYDYVNVSAPGLMDGNWHHVAATYDGDTKRIYLNGVEVGPGMGIPDLNVGAANFRIGSTNNGEYFNGLIDDVRVYDEALSQTQISALASGPSAIPEPSTTALLGLGGLALVLRRRK